MKIETLKAVAEFPTPEQAEEDMKTKKEFLANCTYPKLYRNVLKQMGIPWEEIVDHPMDYRDAGNGVSGFIYYTDTVKFAKRNLYEIIVLLNDLETDVGLLKKDAGDETRLMNWYAWLALESCISDIMNYLEEE